MSKLPTQLRWSEFVAALKTLGYDELPSKAGSARHFVRNDEDPITFHEPHGKDGIRQGTLTEYLRKLDITREQFTEALGGPKRIESSAEERFRRANLPDGKIRSNCIECFAFVAGSESELVIDEAEKAHVCAS